MMRPSPQTEPDLRQLRSLFLSDERQDLLELNAAVRSLAARIGADEALQASVRRVFAQTLDQVGKVESVVISRALAPIVMNGMRQRIKNSADDDVEIMYPLTGRMISASVKSVIASLSDRINSEIEPRFPLRTLLLKLRSRLAGSLNIEQVRPQALVRCRVGSPLCRLPVDSPLQRQNWRWRAECHSGSRESTQPTG